MASSNQPSSSGPIASYSGSAGSDCCPLFVDPLTFISIVAFIGLATYFLQEFIAMSMLMMARQKRRNVIIDSSLFYEGMIGQYILSSISL